MCILIIKTFLKLCLALERLTRYLGAFAALLEDLSSVPSNNVQGLTVSCNSSSGGSDTIS